jgi:hypothetical protein
MHNDVKYILDEIKEDIDTQCVFGNGADPLVQQAKSGYEKLHDLVTDIPEMIENIEAALEHLYLSDGGDRRWRERLSEKLENTLRKLKEIV